ncbi:MAG: hypothetical protein ACKVS6_09670 [Planctomycetota bacterium]
MRISAPVVLGLAVLLLVIAGSVFMLSNPSAGSPEDQSPIAEAPPSSKPVDRETAEASGEKPAESKPADASSLIATAQEPSRTEAKSEAPAGAAAEPEKVGFVTGQVIDFTGNPAPGAKVRIVSKSGPGISFDPTPDAVSDANGKFTAKLKVNKKKTMRVRVTRPDRIAIVVPEVVFKRDETTDLGVLRFEPVASLEVAVMDQENRPIPNIPINIEYPNAEKKEPVTFRRDAKTSEVLEQGAEEIRNRRTTGESGIVNFAAIRPGRVKIIVSEPASTTFSNISSGLSDTAGPSAKVVVTAEGGEDVKKAKETFDNIRANRLKAPDSKEIDIAAGTGEKIEFIFKNLGTLSGRITNNGKPVAEEWIGLHTKSTAGSFLGKFAGHVRTKTDKNGKFTFAPVAPGNYIIKKGDPGEPFRMDRMLDPEEASTANMEWVGQLMGNKNIQDDISRAVEVREGKNQVDLDFGGSTIEVFVQDASSGEAVPNATIRLFDYKKPAENAKAAEAGKSEGFEKIGKMFLGNMTAEKPVRLKGSADAKGRAEFKDLESGDYRIIARVEGRPPSLPADFNLTLGELRQIVVKIPPSMSIAGTVNDHLGNPLENAAVSALITREVEPAFPDELFMMLGGSGPSTSSDKKGKFKLTGVESGAQKLVAVLAGYAPKLLEVTAPSEGHQFFLDKCGSIKIRVTRGGNPAKGVYVSLNKSVKDAPVPDDVYTALGFSQMMELQNHMDTTDENGNALLKNVPPGDWTVDVRSFASGDTTKTQEEFKKIQEEIAKDFENGAKDAASVKKRDDETNARVSKLFGSHSVKVMVFAGQEASARTEIP